MDCEHCQGLMVQDRLYDLQDTNIHCDVWRCICCGNMLDALILLNKRNWQSQLQLENDGLPFKQLTAA